MLNPRTGHQSCVWWTSLSVSGHVSEVRSPRNNYRRRSHPSQCRQTQLELAVLEEDHCLSDWWPPRLWDLPLRSETRGGWSVVTSSFSGYDQTGALDVRH